MNTCLNPAATSLNAAPATRFRIPSLPALLMAMAFVSLLLFFNEPLFRYGDAAPDFVLVPERCLSGEWWRLLTHVWVHVSPYHLLLDASAFFLLFFSLRSSYAARLGQTVVCAMASGLGAWLLAPEINLIGLCGLSGAAHGLMIVSGLETWARPSAEFRRQGAIMTALVAAKALLEVATGSALFAGSHLGSVGTPIPECHLGGVAGGFLCGAVLWARQKFQRRAEAPSDSLNSSEERKAQAQITPLP